MRIFFGFIILFALGINSAMADGPSNRAALSWVPYDRPHDPEDKALQYLKNTGHKKFLESFGIPPENINYLPANNGSLGNLMNQVVAALEKIKDSPNPELVFAVSSHGSPGHLGQQYCKYISQDNFVKTIYAAIEKAALKNPVSLHLAYMSCYSGGLVESLDKTPAPKGTKVYAYVSSGQLEKSKELYFHERLVQNFQITGKAPEGSKYFLAWRTLQEGRNPVSDRGNPLPQTFIGWTNDAGINQNVQKQTALLIDTVLKRTRPSEVQYALNKLKLNMATSKDEINKLMRSSSDKMKDLSVIKILLGEKPTHQDFSILSEQIQSKKWQDIITQELSSNPKLRSELNQAIALDPKVKEVWKNYFSKITDKTINNSFQWAMLNSLDQSLELLKLHTGVPKISELGEVLLKTPQEKWIEKIVSMMDYSLPGREHLEIYNAALGSLDHESWIRQNMLSSMDSSTVNKGMHILYSHKKLSQQEIIHWLKSPNSHGEPDFIRRKIFEALKENASKTQATYEYLFENKFLSITDAVNHARSLPDAESKIALINEAANEVVNRTKPGQEFRTELRKQMSTAHLTIRETYHTGVIPKSPIDCGEVFGKKLFEGLGM